MECWFLGKPQVHSVEHNLLYNMFSFLFVIVLYEANLEEHKKELL